LKLEILTVGTELLNGRSRDAHTAYLGRELTALGLQPSFSTSVSDEASDLELALACALGRSDLVLVSGGLGPTLDDITRESASKVCGCPLAEDPAVAANLRDKFARLGRQMPPNNLKQAQVPQGALVLDNPKGSAPGLLIRPQGPYAGKTLILMPGPPSELHAVFQSSVLPWLRQHHKAPTMLAKSIMIWGLAESAVDALVAGLVPEGDTRSLSMLAHGSHVELRLTCEDQAALDALEVKALALLGDYAFSSEGKPLEAVVAELLSQEGVTVAVAESCTGGRLASKLTALPGSSKFFKSGVVTYSDASKTELLDVPPFVIKKAGAVSKDVALAMAVGLARRSGCDYCLSVTGIAGPDGGSEEKPVGLVHFGLAAPGGPAHQVFHFGPGDRNQIQARAAQAGLFLLYRALMGLPIPEEGQDRATLPGRPGTA
jgi:nicotinamide-nucleotide amidase